LHILLEVEVLVLVRAMAYQAAEVEQEEHYLVGANLRK
jgi:hypothetical protein